MPKQLLWAVLSCCVVLLSLPVTVNATEMKIMPLPIGMGKSKAIDLAGLGKRQRLDARTETLAADLRQFIQTVQAQAKHANSASAPFLPWRNTPFVQSKQNQFAGVSKSARGGGLVPAQKVFSTVDLDIRLTAAGTPRFMRALTATGKRGVMQPINKSKAVADQASRDRHTVNDFLRSYAGYLRLVDPDSELTLANYSIDELGRRHLRFRQQYQGLSVWPADVRVHLNNGGAVDLLTGSYTPTPNQLSLQPVIDKQQASDIARKYIDAPAFMPPARTDLIIYAPSDQGMARLAWKLQFAVALHSEWTVVVDAIDATILTAFNHVHTQNTQGSGQDIFGVTRPLNVFAQDGQFFLVDTSKPMFDPSSTPPQPDTTRGAIIILDALNQPPTNNPQQLPPLAFITSNSPNSGFLADGVSAAFGFSETYDYYLERFGRNSLDDQGGSILAIVRLGQSFPNAFFNSELNLMAFGDALPFAGALDVVGHELTHGVISNSANLIYQNQSGALNEAFADIFGEGVEAFVTGAPDWINGTGLGPNNIRSLEDPSSVLISGTNRPYPKTFSQFIQANDPFLNQFRNRDNGGVHLNSSIVNHAFFLLAEGLDGAIGIVDAEQIFYRALTVHLTQNSQFFDARLATVQSAEELFGAGSIQARKVAEAFTAVEITDIPPTPPPAQISAIDAEDATLFAFRDQSGAFFLGRRESTSSDPVEGIGFPNTNLQPARRPSVLRDGSIAAYVTAANDACFIATASGGQSCFNQPGSVFSVTLSPDGRLFSFVALDTMGRGDNRIIVVDIPTGVAVAIDLFAPTTASDGGILDTILEADAMSFTSDNRFLIYDALNRLSLSDGSTLDAWGIYAIDLATGTILNIAPPQPGVDIGYPALGKTRDDLIAFDVVDRTTQQTQVQVCDLNSGDCVTAAQAAVPFSIPSFSGDDSAIIYADGDANSRSLLRQELSGLSPVGSPSLWLVDSFMGTIYRRASAAPATQGPVTLLNISTNGFVGSEGLIAGFIVDGEQAKTFVIMGENMGGLPDPVIQVTDLSGGQIFAENDNWRDHPSAATVESSLRPLGNDLDAGFALTLMPGTYLVKLTEKNGIAGAGLISITDIESSANNLSLSNISTNGFVEQRGMIAGFIVEEPQQLVITAENMGGLDDPTLVITNVQMNLLFGASDDWVDSPLAVQVPTALGRSPGSPQDAAIVMTLSPGTYLAIMAGKNGTTGEGLISITKSITQ